MAIRLAIKICIIAFLLSAALPLQSTALAHPKPKAVPERPEVNFQPCPLRIFRSPTTGRWFWYMTYDISNYTGEDRIWAPTFTLYTDRGEVLESGRGVKREQVLELPDYVGDDMLELQHEIIGELYQGEGNTRSGLVVWKANRTDVNELSLFVAGISSETTIVEHPLTGEKNTLQKTLMREYLIPGDATALGDAPIGLHTDLDRSPRWIYR